MARELTDAEVFGQAAGPATFTKPGSGITVEVGGSQGGTAPVANPPRGVRNNNPLNIKTQGTAGQDGPFAVYRTPEEGRAAADANLVAYHQKHGINTVAGVVNRWAPPSENDTPAYIAHVAQMTGLDPNAPLDMTNPAVRSKLLDAMQSHESPGSVTAQPQKELSDDEVFGAQSSGDDQYSVPPAPSAPRPVQRALPRVVQEAASGAFQPLDTLGRDVADIYHRKTAQLGDVPRIASDVAALAGAPIQAAIRPLAGVLSRHLPTPSNTHVEWNGIIPHQYVDEKMTPEQAAGAFEGDFNTALQAVKPKGVDLAAARTASAQISRVPGNSLTQQVRAVAPQMPVPAPRGVPPIPQTVSRLARDKKALYTQVDQSGFTFSPNDISKLASDLAAEVRAKGGPKAAKASPQADSMIGRIKALAGQAGGVTLSQLDRVRSDIWPLMMESGGPDTVYGGILRKGIDTLIDGANAPHIAEARAANTRWAKADEVARRVRSAELQAGRANSGENLGNAIRQKLSPMIDPMHSGQVQNLTGAEASALERIVTGDKTQNALRTWGNRLRNPLWTGAATTPATILGFAGGGPVGGGAAAGLTAAGMQAAGQALRGAAERRTMTNVQKLIDLIAGPHPSAAKAKAVTPRGLIGSAALSAPAARQSGSRR